MKIFISAMVLCVLQCQAEAGMRQVSPNNVNIANGSVRRQISTDDMITAPNRPGDIVSGGGRARRDELLPPRVMTGPTYSRYRSRTPLYANKRQTSPDNMITPNGGKRRGGNGYPPDDPSITRDRYPWNSSYGYGRQTPDDILAIPNGGDRKRRRDDLYPPDVMTDPQIRYGRPPNPPYGIPVRPYSTDDMNTIPNRPSSKRNTVSRFLRDNEMTNYLIAKLKLMKDMFDYYEWGSLSATVDQWIATLKEQQKEPAAPVAPVAPVAPEAVPPGKPPSNDNYQYYPYERNSMRVEPCRPYDTRSFCSGL